MSTIDSIGVDYREAVKREDWPGALRHAKLAAEMEPDNPAGWMMTAEALTCWDQPDKALAAIERALALDASRGESWGLKARIALVLGDEGTALDSYRRAAQCDSWRRWDLARALVGFGHFGEAEPIVAELRAKFDDDEDPKAIDEIETNLLIDRVLHEDFAKVGEADGEHQFVPLNYKAIVAMQEAVEKVEALNSTSEVVAARIDDVQGMLSDQLKRRYGGGYLLPIVCAGYGAMFMFLGSAGATEGYLYGSLYLLSVALYLHAARPQTYKLNSRMFKGERGAGQLLVSAASPGLFGEAGAGWLMIFGVCCLGMFAPLAVPYHYIRNYLMK